MAISSRTTPTFPSIPTPRAGASAISSSRLARPSAAITFNDNCISIEMLPGARAGDPGPRRCRSGRGGRRIHAADYDERRWHQARFRRCSPARARILFCCAARFLLGHSAVNLDLAMTDPAQTAARTLKQLLEARGVRVTGSVRVEEAPPPEALKKGEQPVCFRRRRRSIRQIPPPIRSCSPNTSRRRSLRAFAY